MTHSFNTTLAERYGIEASILIEHIYWWIHKNDCEEIEDMNREGKVWCRSTAKGFAKYIPYMKPDKIWRTLKKMEGHILLVGNFNRQALNQTLWYTFTDEFKKELKDLNYDFENFKNANLKNEKSNNSIINNPIKENIIKEDIKKEDNKLSPKKSKFQKPTIEQIDDYIREKNLHFTAEGFFDYYESKGWLVGKSPMKDWKAACRTWEHNRKNINTQEEQKEEQQQTLPDGMTVEEWNSISFQLKANVPHIEALITPFDYFKMWQIVGGNLKTLCEILKEINAYIGEFGKTDIIELFKHKFENKQ